MSVDVPDVVVFVVVVVVVVVALPLLCLFRCEYDGGSRPLRAVSRRRDYLPSVCYVWGGPPACAVALVPPPACVRGPPTNGPRRKWDTAPYAAVPPLATTVSAPRAAVSPAEAPQWRHNGEVSSPYQPGSCMVCPVHVCAVVLSRHSVDVPPVIVAQHNDRTRTKKSKRTKRTC